MTLRSSRYRGAIFIMGVSGLVAQMVLLREFLIISAGNEMTIGIIMANWLVIEAAGAVFGGRMSEKLVGRSAVFVLVTVLFCVTLPPILYAVRVLKATLGVSLGQTLGLGVVFAGSFVLLLPASFTHGALFPLACGVAPRLESKPAPVIGRVYLLENAGTLAGGVLWTWLLVPHFGAFQIAMGVAALNGAGCLALLGLPGASPRAEGRLGIAALAMSVLLLTGAIGVFATGGAERLHETSIGRQWRGQNVVDYRNSAHGNITVVENQGQYSFFTDGTLSLITPIADAAFVKAYAHIPLTVHPDPRRVLLIGGGPGGLIREMLKHPGPTRLDYAEVDPLVIELLQRHSTDLTETELASPRVSVKLTDGRSHLLGSNARYDVILSALTDPADLETNRFFTAEFFELASRRLTADGILVMRMPALIGFQNRELTDLVTLLHRSLASVFPHIRVFPAEGGTMTIASADPHIMGYDVDRLVVRLRERGVSSDLALPWDIERRLHPGWQGWYLELVESGDGRRNRDFAPFGVFLSLSFWSSVHAPLLGPVFRLLDNTRPWMPSAGLLLVAVPFAVAVLTQRRGLAVAPSVFGTGVAGMLFNLSLIFAFQSLFGHLFAWIGLLTAVFMAGSAAGALALTRRLPWIRHPQRVMVYSEAAVLLAAAVLPFVVGRMGRILEATAAFDVLRVLFLVLPFGCGFLTGAQFPVATLLREGETGRTAHTAGLLSAADLTGGWLGGMLGGVFLLPVLGLTGTSATLAFLKLLTLLLYVLSLSTQSSS